MITASYVLDAVKRPFGITSQFSLFAVGVYTGGGDDPIPAPPPPIKKPKTSSDSSSSSSRGFFDCNLSGAVSCAPFIQVLVPVLALTFALRLRRKRK